MDVLIELSGDDRLEWLQGQATNDVRGLTPGGRVSFCLCEPTGQILSIVDAEALDDRILLAVPEVTADAVLARVERMTIMEDVAARLLGPSEGASDEAARIEAGIPRWSVDVGPKTLPAELGPAFEAGHVSYAKGCYTGQEVLMRMHARGHANKTWVGLVSASPLAAGDEVRCDGERVGAVSSAAPSPRFGWVAAATLKNRAVAEGTKVQVGGVDAEVRAMPIDRSL